MAENQETNSFIEAMGAEKPVVTQEVEEVEKISKYAVSPAAESTVSTVAGILLGIGILAAVIGFFGGIIEFGDDESAAGWAFLGGGLLVFLTGVLEWAFLKVFVNISRNLYNINDVLHEIKNK